MVKLACLVQKSSLVSCTNKLLMGGSTNKGTGAVGYSKELKSLGHLYFHPVHIEN